MIVSMACLRANIFKIPIPSAKPRQPEFREKIAAQAATFKMKDFVPDEAAAKEIEADVQKNAGDEEEKKEEKKEEEEEPKVSVDEIENLKKKFNGIFEDLGKPKAFDDIVKAEEFEKDQDSNFHIDFMHALGNCRSLNYKLEPMEWIQVKLKAGRIVPAMATTTSAIAGLQALELVKVIKDVKKEDFRSSFLNLAVPFY